MSVLVQIGKRVGKVTAANISVSQVFPTLTVVGWYTIGDEPTAQDVIIHEQVSDSLSVVDVISDLSL